MLGTGGTGVDGVEGGSGEDEEEDEEVVEVEAAAVACRVVVRARVLGKRGLRSRCQLWVGRYSGRACFTAAEVSICMRCCITYPEGYVCRDGTDLAGRHAPSNASGDGGDTALDRMLARHKAGRMADERIMVAEGIHGARTSTCLTCRRQQPA